MIRDVCDMTTEITTISSNIRIIKAVLNIFMIILLYRMILHHLFAAIDVCKNSVPGAECQKISVRSEFDCIETGDMQNYET